MESSERAGLVLRPFHGVRYAIPDVAAVTSPPYDLISPVDAQALLDVHPNNVVRLILPGAGHYAQAHDLLRDWLASGVLVTDPEPALYVYEQRGIGVFQRGLIGAVGVDSDAVLPHENVMPGPVADRLALMRSTEANLEPIFLLYAGGGPASALVDEVASGREPLVDVPGRDGVRHRLWAVTDATEIAAVAEDLAGRQALIADGHHRYATYQALREKLREERGGPGPWDQGLALLVDSAAYPPGLKAIHRVIPGLPLAEAVARAKGAWQVHEFTSLEDALAGLAAASGPAYVLAGVGNSHLLTHPDQLQVEHAMPREMSERWRSLGTSILNEFLLPKVWGIEDDERTVLIVHHDIEAAVRLARQHSGTAVLLNPLKAADVFEVAVNGERVPRKSTSFSPKPATGLVLRTFAAD
ncbi:hypothetical protein Aph01nite_79120 [Acrocarpospora phusangensis]|uniref:DUF1015 domain-containing protein n=1 Tax=Acrocarpospora phusangensis TaxID=1070424 RepID=A0A919QIJ6_9ACTN|nr:DUF1015 domain-containing protein [Acrocarpospora phusangensis]GIH29602.1 hypothetical protein Aph01nite_79120 [Acrocarpospora phusangensis]